MWASASITPFFALQRVKPTVGSCSCPGADRRWTSPSVSSHPPPPILKPPLSWTVTVRASESRTSAGWDASQDGHRLLPRLRLLTISGTQDFERKLEFPYVKTENDFRFENSPGANDWGGNAHAYAKGPIAAPEPHIPTRDRKMATKSIARRVSSATSLYPRMLAHIHHRSPF
jgi:hypothetical protein